MQHNFWGWNKIMPQTNYERGRAYEYRIMAKLKGDGWEVIRASGSHGCADLVALKAGKIRLLQCKLGKKYLDPFELQKKMDFEKKTGFKIEVI